MVNMFGGQTQDPQVFISALRQYLEANEGDRGEIANALSEAIVAKKVDLAEVRQILLDTGQADLMDALDRFLDLIEPYLMEGSSGE